MTPKAINAALDVLIARAPDLRRAGITSLAIGDLSLDIGTPWIDPPTVTDARGIDAASDEPPPDFTDPLDDPATYARGRRPGFQRPKTD